MVSQAKTEHQQNLQVLFNKRSYHSTNKMSLYILLLLALSSIAASQSTVKYLPGYDGELPFSLETGYIGIGDTDDVQLFYYFVESEREPAIDPLVLWLAGGPGCSGFAALAYEIGPLLFDVEAWTGHLPSLILNEYSWTKVANILFIDQPVGTGFSYARTSAGYNTSDTEAVEQVYAFLRKWLVYHPQYQTNPLYIGGNSYSGITVPLVVQTILDGLDEGLQPLMGLQGYILGNPLTDTYIDVNSRIQYVNRVNLISDELHEDAKLYCDGDYINVEFNNTRCLSALMGIKQCLLQINMPMVLEPHCVFASARRKEIEWDLGVEEAETTGSFLSQIKNPNLKCRSFGWMLSHKWANNKDVQLALNVRPETLNSSWVRCVTLPFYTEDVSSTVAYHKNFTKTGLRALIYSGDQDAEVPYIGTQEWINLLGISVSDEWRPWYVDGQIGGYTQKYMNDNYFLTYATVKGGGNAAPEYRHKDALGLFARWTDYYPI